MTSAWSSGLPRLDVPTGEPPNGPHLTEQQAGPLASSSAPEWPVAARKARSAASDDS